MTALLVACSAGQPATGPEPFSPASTTSTTAVGGLDSSVVSFLYPINGEELQLGQRTFELPILRRANRDLATCVGDQGYRQYAEALLGATPAIAIQAWLYPDVPSLRADGFDTPPPDPALNLLGSINGDTDAADAGEFLVEDLERNPQFGVPATIESANALNAAIVQCLTDATPDATYESVQLIQTSWRRRLSDIDDTEELAQLTEGLLTCVRAIDVVFVDVSSVEDWWATQFGEQINLDFDPSVGDEEFRARMGSPYQMDETQRFQVRRGRSCPSGGGVGLVKS